MRGVVIAVVGILALTAGAMGFIYLATGDAPAAAGRASPVQEAPPPDEAPLPPPPMVDAPPSPPPALAVAPGEFTPAPARARPVEGTWEAIPLASRARKLGGKAGGSMEAGLQELQPLVAGCFTRNVETMEEEAAGLPTVVLHLESGPGTMTIVDAIPNARGGASDDLLKCAIGALKGRTFNVAGMKPGQRQRLLHSIKP